MEGRTSAIIDVPGAFMQADMNELVHVRFTGVMVELLLELDPELYTPFVTMKNNEKVMYVQLLKAQYGTVRAAQLFFEKLTGRLTKWDFTANPYDPCVMNKIVNGSQLAIAWHVNDLKVSLINPTLVYDFISNMEKEFGQEVPLNQSRGKVHDYLGMKLDYTVPGQVSFTMINYIKTILHECPKAMHGSAATPAANHLFHINKKDPKLLSKDRAEAFVHIVMQLLYLSQRARPDIRTAVTFLCGRLTQPDEDDYKKLTRVVRYLDYSVDLPLVLRAAPSGKFSSTKQKLVSRGSTESEVIGVHDVLPQLLWTTHLLKEQGMTVDKSVLYEDNSSSIFIERNGRRSSTKRTRHMDVHFFYIKDQIDQKHVIIEYCRTDKMLADYFTKPLQGAQFSKLRDQIMKIDPSSKYYSVNMGPRSVMKSEITKHTINDNNSTVTVDPDASVATSGGMARKSYKDVLLGVNPRI